MAENVAFNLDPEQDYIEFVLNKKKYLFRHLTARQITQFSKLNLKDFAALDFFAEYITAVEPETPAFKDVCQDMSLPQIEKFLEMLKSQLSLT